MSPFSPSQETDTGYAPTTPMPENTDRKETATRLTNTPRVGTFADRQHRVVPHPVGVQRALAVYTLSGVAWTALQSRTGTGDSAETPVLIQGYHGVCQAMSALTRCPKPVQFGEREPLFIVHYVVSNI